MINKKILVISVSVISLLSLFLYALAAPDFTSGLNVSSGNVGIGLTNPGTKLDVAGIIKSDLRVLVESAMGTAAMFTVDEFGAGEAGLYYNSGQKIATFHEFDSIYQYAGGLIFVNGSNIGIGTTAPNDIFSIGNDAGLAAPAGSPLTGHNHVSTYLSTDRYALTNYGIVETLIAAATSSLVLSGGADNMGDHKATQNIYLNSFWLSSDGSNSGIRIDANGNVGISTSTLTTSLNIGGRPGLDGLKFPDGTLQTSSFSGTLSAANVTAGAFGSAGVGGNYSFPSSLSVGTAIAAGSLNVQNINPASVAVVALRSRSAAMGVPFISMYNSSGTSFLDINANCVAETFIGVGAGVNADTGSCTGALFVGYNAGNRSTRGLNVAIGPNAFANSITGESNSVLGYSAMQNSTGSFNIAVGKDSMLNQTGSNNVALGASALSGSSPSTNNVAVGYGAMAQSGSGGSSVAIGAGAGFSNADTNNVFLGTQAGYNHIVGSGNIFIGYQAGYNSDGNDDELYIDNSNTASPLIYGNFNSNQVIINGTFAATGGLCIGADCRTSWEAANGGYSAVAANTTAYDFRTADVFQVSPSASATYTATAGPAGQTGVIVFLSSGTTARTITFGSGFRSAGTINTGTVSAQYFTVTFVSNGSVMVETSRVATAI